MYSVSLDVVVLSEYEFDELDCFISICLLDGSIFQIDYDFGEIFEGINCCLIKLIDFIGGEYYYYIDSRECFWVEVYSGLEGLIWMQYQYNVYGECIRVIDVAGNSISFKFDMLGCLMEF